MTFDEVLPLSTDYIVVNEHGAFYSGLYPTRDYFLANRMPKTEAELLARVIGGQAVNAIEFFKEHSPSYWVRL